LKAFLRDPRLVHTVVMLETPISELESGQQDWAAERQHTAKARALAGLPMPQAAVANAPAGTSTIHGA
jgi:hypothetical protein